MNDFISSEEDKPKLPVFLNVLTILTFVWCAYELYTGIRNYSGGAKALQQLKDAQPQMEKAPAWVKKFAGPEMMEIVQKGIENRLPILIISIVAIALCVFGALEMRKLKKQGYLLWLVGELLPIVGAGIFIGAAFFKSIVAIFLIFPIIFIILYTTQRKYLVY